MANFYQEKVFETLITKIENLDINHVSVPKNRANGDFSYPCFGEAKRLGRNPVEFAKELESSLETNEFISKIEATGPFLNFTINKGGMVVNTLGALKEKGADFAVQNNSDKTIVIDYAAPNVAKNMGLHNLRSTVIGQCLYNVYKYLGYKTVGINHLGDWGTQFGKLIWSLEKWSNPEELEEKGILFLNQLYVKFHDLVDEVKVKDGDEAALKIEDEARAWFKKIEDGDDRAKMWWQMFVDISLTEYDKIFARLGVSFDDTRGESYYITHLDKTIKTLEDAKLTCIDEGALVVKFDEKEKLNPCLLRKSDGATLYGTRDLAAAMYRQEKYNPTKVLYVVDTAQQYHFKQWFKVMELLDSKNKDIFEHVWFGRLLGMSTRKGKNVPLMEVLDKARDKCLESINEKSPDLENKEEVAEMLGSGAIIFGDLVNDRIHDNEFSWERVLDFNGETSIYCQYAYARIKSILGKEDSDEFIASKLTSEKEIALVEKLGGFKDTLADTIRLNKPSVLCRYVVDLSQEFTSYYANTPILKDCDEETKKSRLFLIKQVSEVIKKSLNLIGVKVAEKM